MSEDAYFLDQIVADAEAYYEKYSAEQRWEMLIDEWIDVESRTAAVRPSRTEVMRYLKDVVNQVISKLVLEETRITRATIAMTANALIKLLATKYPALEAYRIPLAVLVTVCIDALIDQAKSRLEAG